MADSYQPPLGSDAATSDDRADDHDDPWLNEPGTQGQPGSLVDTDHNMPGQQGDPSAPPDAGREPSERSEDHSTGRAGRS